MAHRLARLLIGLLVVLTALVDASSSAVPAAATGGGPATLSDTGSDTSGRPGVVVGGPQLAGPGVVVSRGSGVPRVPKADAKAFVVADLGTDEVLAAKDAHRQLRPASTLKVLTALAALPHVNLSDSYVATDEDANMIGSRVGLYPGGRYTVDQLLRSMIIASGNDAAHALANAAGGRRVTVRRMNALATHLQAHDTTAGNVTGLDRKGQFTSAYDLALFGRAAMANPHLRRYASMVNTTLPDRQRERADQRRAGKGRDSRGGRADGPAKPPTYEVWTINRLLLNYKGAIGLKTGWTTLARGTYIGVAERQGRTLMATVMGSEGESWEAAAALLDWGFAADDASPVGTLVEPAAATPEPEGGSGSDSGGAVATAGTRAAAGDSPRDAGDVLTWPLVLLVGVVLPLVVLRTSARRRRADAAK